MLVRFAESCRKVMTWANQEALRYNHEYIGPEHILLGLASVTEGLGVQVLHNFSIDIDNLRKEIESLVKTGNNTLIQGKLPQSPQAKRVIESSISEARSLNHCEIRTEHLLLGLLKDKDSASSLVLTTLGVTYERAREQIINLLGGGEILEENQNRHAFKKTDMNQIQLFDNEDSFTKCPKCEYDEGFHTLFYNLKNKELVKLILLCPSCKSKFDIGLRCPLQN